MEKLPAPCQAEPCPFACTQLLRWRGDIFPSEESGDPSSPSPGPPSSLPCMKTQQVCPPPRSPVFSTMMRVVGFFFGNQDQGPRARPQTCSARPDAPTGMKAQGKRPHTKMLDGPTNVGKQGAVSRQTQKMNPYVFQHFWGGRGGERSVLIPPLPVHFPQLLTYILRAQIMEHKKVNGKFHCHTPTRKMTASSSSSFQNTP